MRIINVIEIKSGIVSQVESFVMSSEAELDPNKARRVVTKAKCCFEKKAIENGCRSPKEAIENREYDNLNGYNILLIESEKVS